MPIIVDRRGQVRGDIVPRLAGVEALAVDLELISTGQVPTDRQLASAPLLDRWRLVTREVPCLIGNCSGHPLLNGPVIITSELWVIAPSPRWARTLSRFYRLGERDVDDAS